MIQAYDFYFLHNTKDCKVQIGGSDQWGNITAGIELIKKISGERGYALTTPLLTKSDGSKFGKTELGNIWLDPQRTSPYKFYQYWMNVSDEDAEKWIKIFTTIDEQEMNHINQHHHQEPHLRLLQKELAKRITCRVHDEAAYHQSVRVSDILFGKDTAHQIKEITEEYKIVTIINSHDMNSVMEIGEKIIFLKKGNKEWDKTFGGSAREEGYSVLQDSNQGYIIIFK